MSASADQVPAERSSGAPGADRSSPSSPPGPVALVGGGEWQEGCDFDAGLWERSGADEVVVLPTAAAYEHPERAVETARGWFGRIGAPVRPLMVLSRRDAEDPDNVEAARRARFVYLGGGSPLHLRSVLKDSPVWDALVAAWREGAVVAGSSAGAMVLGDPMVDPRGGALTIGLGLLPGLAVMPHSDLWSADKARRTVQLATGDLRIAAVDERTALVREADGTWWATGAGGVAVYVEGERRGIEVLGKLGVA